VVMLPEIASSAARLATSSKMARRTLRQVHLVTLIRKPDISGRIFAITQNQTTNISEELPGISSIRDVEYDIDCSGASLWQNPHRISPVKCKIARIFQQEIVQLHGTPSAIVSDKDPRFTFRILETHTRQEGYTNKLSRPLKLSAKLSCFLESIAYEWRQTFWYYRQDLFHQTIRNSRSRREISYRLALPPQLSHVHNVFHVSLLRGYKYHPLHVISYPFDQIREDLSYTEEPESILDRQDRVMRNKTIPFVKILWSIQP
ncbi:hypothetical protein Tco_1434024, partial [Tanacetum coccineum]